MSRGNRKQLAFNIDEKLAGRLKRVAQHLKTQKITQADISRSAINEKVRDLEDRIERGEEILLTI